MSCWLRLAGACVLLLGAQHGPAANPLPDRLVLAVDSARVESDTATLKRLREQAAKHPELSTEAVTEGIELGLSEILTALPEVVAELARARKADLVVQLGAWPETAGEPPEDITEAVITRLDERLRKLSFSPP